MEILPLRTKYFNPNRKNCLTSSDDNVNMCSDLPMRSEIKNVLGNLEHFRPAMLTGNNRWTNGGSRHRTEQAVRVENTAYMHDGAVFTFECEYGEQMRIARGFGDVLLVTSTLRGDEQADEDADGGRRHRPDSLPDGFDEELAQGVMTRGCDLERGRVGDARLGPDPVDGHPGPRGIHQRIENLFLGLVGKEDVVELEQLVEHHDLQEHPLHVHVGEPLDEITVLPSVLPDAEEEPEQVCGWLLHAAIVAPRSAWWPSLRKAVRWQ